MILNLTHRVTWKPEFVARMKLNLKCQWEGARGVAWGGDVSIIVAEWELRLRGKHDLDHSDSPKEDR